MGQEHQLMLFFVIHCVSLRVLGVGILKPLMIYCPWLSTYLLQFDCVFGALQHAGAAGNTLFWIVKDDLVTVAIRGPAAYRAYLVALPDSGTSVWIIMNLQIPQGTGNVYVFG
jgi:hypothetical protein